MAFIVIDPGISYWMTALRRDEGFTFCKLNHAFWETAFALECDPGIEADASAPAWTPRGWLALHGHDLMSDLISFVRSVHDYSIHLAISPFGPPDTLVGTAPSDLGPLLKFIASKLCGSYVPIYGQLWKRYALEGNLDPFLRALREFPIIAVGLPHLAELKRYFDAEPFIHINVGLDATRRRLEILRDIERSRISLGAGRVAVLLQAGESMSAWLISKLHGRIGNTSWIDLGRSLDAHNCSFSAESLAAVPDLTDQEWRRTYKSTMHARLKHL